MSEVEVCQLAYEGKIGILKYKIDLDNSVSSKTDQVRTLFEKVPVMGER